MLTSGYRLSDDDRRIDNEGCIAALCLGRSEEIGLELYYCKEFRHSVESTAHRNSRTQYRRGHMRNMQRLRSGSIERGR